MPPQKPVVQISLDLTSIEEALDHARKAVRAGVNWLEAGTPLILAEGLRAVRSLRGEFPRHPIVADLKTMDGGYLEAEMMAKAGATHVVVMARAHPATIKVVVKAGRDFGIQVMGDDLGCDDKPAAARMMEELGVDYVDLSQMSGRPEFLYDDCHFNEEGAREVSKRVADYLLAHPTSEAHGNQSPGKKAS